MAKKKEKETVKKEKKTAVKAKKIKEEKKG